MLTPGTMLQGRYEILEHIGSGGMADVYKAKCHKLNRYVAIKILKSEYNEDENAVKKFVSEAQATADLQHANIVNIYDAEHTDDMHYIVMELAEGITLKKYIQRYGRLSIHETVDFALQIARGIEAAHAQKIIHRDIKPQNILVSNAGKIKVTDFGIAKVATGDTVGLSPFGSVHYFSPEQARGGYADERSDIYSLGITIYEMVTGKVPFDAENSVSIALKHLHEEITPPRTYYPDIPVSLENIILKCTMKRQDMRYQSVKELITDLEQVFSSPEGSYVRMESLVDDSPTNIRGEQEIETIKRAHRRKRSGDSYVIEEEPHDDTGIYGEDYEEEDMEEGSHKLAVALAIIAGVIIVIVAVFFIVREANLLGNSRKPADKILEATTAPVSAETVAMPNVVAMSKEDAQKTLKGYSLTAKFKYEEGVDEDSDSLIVVKQSVKENEEVAVDTEVTLTLGSNEAPSGSLSVPSVVDMTKEEAQKEIKSAGFACKIVYENNANEEDGKVISQKPAEGTALEAGEEVEITVNSQAEMVTVPSLIGLTETVARSQLEAAGLKLGSIVKGHSNNVSAGEIMDQDVSTGSQVPANTEISIKLSVGLKYSNIYQASLRIADSPLEDGEEGVVEMILSQGDETLSIFYDEDADSSQFPLDLTFDAITEGEGTVLVYVNGEEYTSIDVNASLVQESGE